MSVFEAQDLSHLLMLCGAASVAGFVRGFAGFGGPATISLLLAHFFVPATLLPKIALLDFYAYPLLLWTVRREAHWRISLPISITVVLMLPFGVHTMQTMDPELLKKFIGGACLAAVAVSMTGFRFSRQPSLWVSLAVAVTLGWVLGATYIMLPLVTYFLLMPMSASACRATIISVTIVVMPFLIAVLFWYGTVTIHDILPVGAAGIAYMAMVMVGSWVFSRVSERDYRKAAQWLLLILSVTVVI